MEKWQFTEETYQKQARTFGSKLLKNIYGKVPAIKLSRKIIPTNADFKKSDLPT